MTLQSNSKAMLVTVINIVRIETGPYLTLRDRFCHRCFREGTLPNYSCIFSSFLVKELPENCLRIIKASLLWQVEGEEDVIKLYFETRTRKSLKPLDGVGDER